MRERGVVQSSSFLVRRLGMIEEAVQVRPEHSKPSPHFSANFKPFCRHRMLQLFSGGLRHLCCGVRHFCREAYVKIPDFGLQLPDPKFKVHLAGPHRYATIAKRVTVRVKCVDEWSTNHKATTCKPCLGLASSIPRSLFREGAKIEMGGGPKQKGGTDCGVFAIATCTSLAHSYQPKEFTHKQMRAHLVKCFENFSFRN